jgi:O-antigen/teichoic acid export membrane protein
MAVLSLVFPPAAQAVASAVLLLIVSTVWYVRRSRKAWEPSKSFFDLVAFLMATSCTSTISAMLVWLLPWLPRLVVAAAIAVLLVGSVMRKLAPR